MSKNKPFAKEEIMEDYLGSLLQETEDPAEVAGRAAKLLEQANQYLDAEPVVAKESPLPTAPDKNSDEPSLIAADVAVDIDDSTEAQPQAVAEDAAPPALVKPLQERLDHQFQALFFEVAGLTLAVPLITLGGIHNISKIGPLFGKPTWFLGVMLHRDEKLNVVDTAQWVMPEKYDQNLADQLNYQYLIMLNDSEWGLASEKLVNTVSLTKDDVKWRQSGTKRPWLAGMVKDKMCALLDVDELISMLNNGLGSNDLVP